MVGLVVSELGRQKKKLTDQLAETKERSRSVRATALENSSWGTAPEEWHPRLSSGFHTRPHTCTFTYTHICTYTYVCTPRYTNRYTHAHTYAYTQNSNAPNRAFSTYKYVLHILISLSYRMHQNF